MPNKIIKKINYNGVEYEVGIQNLASADADGLMSSTDKVKFDNGIWIAGNQVKPGDSLSTNTLVSSLGLSNAMHFVGIATVDITDGSTTNPTISGYTFSNAKAGDVILDRNSAWEYVWTGSKWEKLGPDSYGLSISGHTVSIVPGGSTLSVTVPDNNTWQANSSSQEGYVASGSGQANKVWKTDANGNPAWRDDANNTYSLATNSNLGLVKPWFNHTAASSGPTAGSNSTAITVNSISTTAGKYYAIESDSNGRLFVNVPWTDANTWNANTATQAGYVASPSSAANKVWKTDSSGNPGWRDDANTTYSVATSSNLGLVKLGSDTVQTVAATSVGSTANRTYAIQKNSSDQLVVNVPWTDNNTWTANDATHAGYVASPNSAANKVWKTNSSGVPSWQDDANTTYGVAKYNTLGLVKPAYTSTNSVTLTTAAASNTTSPTIATKATEANRYYGVEADVSGILFVNVPWTDNNTWTAMQGATAANNGVAGYIGTAPPKDGYDTKYWRADGTWAVPPNTTYSKATSSALGLVKLGSDTVQSVAMQTVSAQANRTYAVQLNSSDQMVVNVPWTDNNTDEKVKNEANNAQKAYITGTSSSTTNTGTQYFDTNVYLSTTAGELVATTFTGALNGNAATATKATQDGSGNNIVNTYATKTELGTLSTAMVFKGTIGSSGSNPTVTTLPNTHNVGWTYRVITAGTYAGVACEVGDVIICVKDGTAAAAADWSVLQTNIDGAVTGPTSATDKQIAIFNGTTGKQIKGGTIASHSYTPAGSVTVTTNATTNKTATVSPASSGDATYTPAGSIAVSTAGATVAADDITAWTTNTPTVVTKKTVVTSATFNTVVTGGSKTSIPNITKKTVVTSASYDSGILTLNTGDSVTTGTAIEAYTSLTTGASGSASTGDSVSVTAGTAASLSYTARTVKSGDAAYSFTGTGVRLVTGNIAVPNTYTASFSGTAATLSHTIS